MTIPLCLTHTLFSNSTLDHSFSFLIGFLLASTPQYDGSEMELIGGVHKPNNSNGGRLPQRGYGSAKGHDAQVCQHPALKAQNGIGFAILK